MSDCLLLFTRYPVPGKTKTRLSPALTSKEAAELHRSMTETIGMTLHFLQDEIPIDIEILFTDCTLTRMKNWMGDGFSYAFQGEGNLGAKLKRGFKESFQKGYGKVIGIGSDCPSLTSPDLKQALELLNDRDCVIGPAFDGGYYLIGMKKDNPFLFEDINWSSSIVFEQTITKIKQRGLSWAELRPLGDIDRPEDLGIWLQCQLKTKDIPKISVIIPTLNEAEKIKDTLLSLSNEVVEVIVVDGGSQDQTIEIVQYCDIKIVTTEPHRAKQMNLGATIAQGDILLFLHGDTKLPQGFVSQIITTLAKPSVVGGAFLLGIDGEQWGLSLIEWGANFRSKTLQLPYGDQGIFLTKNMFNKINGFPEIKIMEDFELIKKLHKYGRIAIASTKVKTSSRRWQRLGIIKTTLVNQLIILGYYLGIDPDRLGRWYRNFK